MLKKISVFALAIGIALVALTSHAADSRADVKRYPASFCHAMSPTYYSNITYGTYALYNSNETYDWLYVVCPIVLDASTVSSAWISMRDMNPNDEFVCYFRNISYSGSYSSSSAVLSGISNVDSYVQKRSFTNIPSDKVDGVRQIQCTMAKKVQYGSQSYIVAYSVDE